MPTITTRTIGSAGGRDYSMPQAWEDAAPANLVTSDVLWDGVAYNDSAFAPGSGVVLTVAGSTTDATRRKQLTAAAGESIFDDPANALFFDATKGVSFTGQQQYSQCLVVTEANFRISRIQLRVTNGQMSVISGSASGSSFDQLIVYANNAHANARCGGFSAGTASNCLFFADAVTGSNPVITCSLSAALNNCTIAKPAGGHYPGLGLSYTSSTFRNNVMVGATTGFTKPATATGVTYANCFQDVSSAVIGVTGGLAYSTSTFVNVTSGSRDFKLVSGSALIDAGTSSGVPAYDIFGTTRPAGAGYDVGAHEYVSAAVFKAFWARNANTVISSGITR